MSDEPHNDQPNTDVGEAATTPASDAEGVAAEQPATDADLKARVQEIFDEMINPAVAMHGGYISLLDVRENKVYVEMGGGCQGCGAAQMTLKAGVEAMLMEELPQIIEVIDETDHGSGDNPYFAAAKY